MAIAVVNAEPRGLSVDAILPTGEVFAALVPADLLDDEVGDNSTVLQRQNWVLKHSGEIEKAIIAKYRGGIIIRPFDRIIPREAK